METVLENRTLVYMYMGGGGHVSKMKLRHIDSPPSPG